MTLTIPFVERYFFYMGGILSITLSLILGFSTLYSLISRPRIFLFGEPYLEKTKINYLGQQEYNVHYKYQLINKGKSAPIRLVMRADWTRYRLSDFIEAKHNEPIILEGIQKIRPTGANITDFRFPLDIYVAVLSISGRRLISGIYTIGKSLCVDNLIHSNKLFGWLYKHRLKRSFSF